MIRTQVQLTERQAHELRRVAAERGVSMAAVIRELIEASLTVPARTHSTRARSAIGKFGSGGNTTSRDHDRELDSAFGD
jgi:hypothetical protein